MARDKTSRPADETAARRERLAAELRENLRRRKAQARARDPGPGEAGDNPPAGPPTASTTREG